MKTVALQPVSDVTQVWAQVPSDGLAHALKVDDGFATPDNDTTYLRRTTEIGAEALQLQSLPHDLKQSVAYRLRATVRASDADNTLAVQVFVDGVNYDDPAAVIEWAARPLNAWGSYEATLTVLPVLTGDESIRLVFVGSIATGSVDITQVELEIDYLPHPDRPTGTGQSRNPLSTFADPGKPTATAAPRVPTATAAILTPTATGQIITPKGTPE